MMVKIAELTAGLQELLLPIPWAVRVRITLPDNRSFGPGVYVGFNAILLSNDPSPELLHDSEL